MVLFLRCYRYRGDAMTPAERKAQEAVVRAAKRWQISIEMGDEHLALSRSFALSRAVSRLLREEAKKKGKRRGK